MAHAPENHGYDFPLKSWNSSKILREAVKEQFGADYKRMNKFKEVFRVALRQVLARYQNARLDADEGGLMLRNSPPPVRRPAVLLPAPAPDRAPRRGDI